MILGMFQKCFKWVSRKLKECAKKTFRVFQGKLRGVSRKNVYRKFSFAIL